MSGWSLYRAVRTRPVSYRWVGFMVAHTPAPCRGGGPSEARRLMRTVGRRIAEIRARKQHFPERLLPDNPVHPDPRCRTKSAFAAKDEPEGDRGRATKRAAAGTSP